MGATYAQKVNIIERPRSSSWNYLTTNLEA